MSGQEEIEKLRREKEEQIASQEERQAASSAKNLFGEINKGVAMIQDAVDMGEKISSMNIVNLIEEPMERLRSIAAKHDVSEMLPQLDKQRRYLCSYSEKMEAGSNLKDRVLDILSSLDELDKTISETHEDKQRAKRCREDERAREKDRQDAIKEFIDFLKSNNISSLDVNASQLQSYAQRIGVNELFPMDIDRGKEYYSIFCFAVGVLNPQVVRMLVDRANITGFYKKVDDEGAEQARYYYGGLLSVYFWGCIRKGMSEDDALKLFDEKLDVLKSRHLDFRSHSTFFNEDGTKIDTDIIADFLHEFSDRDNSSAGETKISVGAEKHILKKLFDSGCSNNGDSIVSDYSYAEYVVLSGLDPSLLDLFDVSRISLDFLKGQSIGQALAIIRGESGLGDEEYNRMVSSLIAFERKGYDITRGSDADAAEFRGIRYYYLCYDIGEISAIGAVALAIRGNQKYVRPFADLYSKYSNYHCVCTFGDSRIPIYGHPLSELLGL